MFENIELSELEDRGFIGAIACSSSGAVIEATSDDLEVFGSVLSYITQVADMIGEPFGMDSIEEVHLECAQTKAICIPQDDECLGVLCHSRVNVEEILGELLN
jgi:predicted regulator of Ras-like GTPase activity (Roadblock/LC7/MglB family)